MKVSIFAAAALCLGLAACASPNEGNPNGAAYLGSQGSTYDATANPPRAAGSVSYDPRGPLPPTPSLSAPSAMPAPGSAMPR
ncbi:MAG TPA: hypothetical protein VGM68_07160 [Rhizomicrobium sp.]